MAPRAPRGSKSRPLTAGDDLRAAIYGTSDTPEENEKPEHHQPTPTKLLSVLTQLSIMECSPPAGRAAAEPGKKRRRPRRRTAHKAPEIAANPPLAQVQPEVVYAVDDTSMPALEEATKTPTATVAPPAAAADAAATVTREADAVEAPVEIDSAPSPGPPEPSPAPVATPAQSEASQEELPSWLREASDLMAPSSSPTSRRVSGTASNAATRSAVDRLLEERKMLEGLLRDAAEKSEAQERMLEEERANASAERARVRSRDEEMAVMTLKLERASDEIAKLEKAELAAQVTLCKKAHAEAEAQALLAHERQVNEKRLAKLSAEGEEVRARLTDESAAERAALLEENAQLKRELTRTRIALAGGMLGTTALRVAGTPSSDEALRSIASPPAATPIKKGLTSRAPNEAVRAAAAVCAEAAARRSASKGTGNKTPGKTPGRTPSQYKALGEQLAQLEAAIADKENEMLY